MAKRRLKTLSDLRRYLSDVINRVESGRLDPSVAGRLGFLCNSLRAVIEKGDIEQRLDELERRIDGGHL